MSYASSLPVVRWRLEKDNSSSLSSHLVGFAHVNGSADALVLRLETHDTTASGRVLTGSDEDHLDTLFTFGFSQIKGSVPLSVGLWSGADVAGDSAASGLMQTSGNDRWTLLVTPSQGRTIAQVAKGGAKKRAAAASDDDDDLHSEGPASTGHPQLSAAELGGATQILFVAHRVLKEENKSFFARYGSYLMLVGQCSNSQTPGTDWRGREGREAIESNHWPTGGGAICSDWRCTELVVVDRCARSRCCRSSRRGTDSLCLVCSLLCLHQACCWSTCTCVPSKERWRLWPVRWREHERSRRPELHCPPEPT